MRFSSKEEADRAIGALNNVPLPQNGAKPIYVKVVQVFEYSLSLYFVLRSVFTLRE